MLEERFAQHDKIPGDKYVEPDGRSYEMSTRDYIVRPQTYAWNAVTERGGPIVITLPRVAEAKGQWYSIIARRADETNTITVQNRGDSECWVADMLFKYKCKRILLYSDGLAWFVQG